MKIGDVDLAIENYQKSVNLDPQNNNAKEMIKELQKKKGS
jgi:Tfp pilus assembly protein PilF